MIKDSDIYRQNAENCLQRAEAAKDEAAFKRFKRMEAAWLCLAEERTGSTASDRPLIRLPSEGKMTDPTRLRGTGTLLVKGAEESPVEYEITIFEVDTISRAKGWVEAGPAVLTYAQSASGAQLSLTDGRVVDVSIGGLSVTGSQSRAELIVHGGL